MPRPAEYVWEPLGEDIATQITYRFCIRFNTLIVAYRDPSGFGDDEENGFRAAPL
ncbi:MAG: hypothetical protein Fur005_35900 [Roseiflexaceae bacterium]